MKRTRRNPSDAYSTGKRLGFDAAVAMCRLLDQGTVALGRGESRASVVRKAAWVAAAEEHEEAAPYYDEPERRGGRYTWEDFEDGVRYGIDLAVDKDAATG
jgi:hypothetical protein